jgi:hypothetical protein
MSEQFNQKGGPRTKAGRDICSGNSLKHGLSVDKLIIPGEDPAEFEALEAAFQEDFNAQTTIEAIMVHDLAKSHWLKERAIRLSQQAFFSVEAMDPKHLALMIRYQTANERAFLSTLKALQAIQKQRLEAQRKSVSKKTLIPAFWDYDENGFPIPDDDEKPKNAQNDPAPQQKK